MNADQYLWDAALDFATQGSTPDADPRLHGRPTGRATLHRWGTQ